MSFFSLLDVDTRTSKYLTDDTSNVFVSVSFISVPSAVHTYQLTFLVFVLLIRAEIKLQIFLKLSLEKLL